MKQYKSHFTVGELACQCCGQGEIRESTWNKLEAARNIAGIPFVINSGFRCKKSNDALIAAGKSVEQSAHTTGNAVDIRVSASSTRYKVLDALLRAGFTRIGIGKTFIHADDDPAKPQGVIWGYND